ncbi:hypothetical protein NAI87_14990 [Clavibacter michiganensis subsp. michiganensis]|uniref:hypothetical protein n=1 Tax=Clavibacter michiganensis TaxID=28447 RepID=UPI001365C8A5|nr:hypothetical protein [Clavibacter michiganensis]
MDYESLPLLGAPFEHVETYVYFDGPQTFALRSRAMPDLYYVVNTVEESDDETSVTALAVAVNEDRFRAVRSGMIQFRDTFAGAAPFSLFSIVWTFIDGGPTEVDIAPQNPSEVANSWLPTPGARLKMPTATVEPFVASELVSLSEAQGRTIFALEVRTPDSLITGFPGRYAGELQTAVDGEVVALTREIVTQSKSPHRYEIRSSVLDLRAASFAVVMGIDSIGTLAEATDVTEVIFERLNELILAVGHSDVAFLRLVKEHTPTVRNRFLDMLTAASGAGSGLALSSVVAHSRRVVRASASPARVQSAVEAFELVEPRVDHVDLERGILTGLVLRRQRFEIVDAANPEVTYKGEMTATATTQANGLRVGDDSFVAARIRVETPFTSGDETTGARFILEEIRLFSASERGRQSGPSSLL